MLWFVAPIHLKRYKKRHVLLFSAIIRCRQVPIRQILKLPKLCQALSLVARIMGITERSIYRWLHNAGIYLSD